MSKTQQLQTTLVAIKYMSRVSPEVSIISYPFPSPSFVPILSLSLPPLTSLTPSSHLSNSLSPSLLSSSLLSSSLLSPLSYPSLVPISSLSLLPFLTPSFPLSFPPLTSLVPISSL